MKKVLCGLLTGLMLLSLPATGVFAAPVVAKNVTPLTITSNSIKIYDDQVSNLASEKVYVKNVETEHSGLSSGNGVVNRVLTITKGGTYQLEGAAAKTQIYVDAPSDDVTLILDDLNLSCESAPVLVVNRANSLEIQLAKDSENTLTGGYYETYTDSVGKTISRGGAISAECDVTITGMSGAGADGEESAKGMVTVITHAARIAMPMAELVDMEKEKARLEKQLAKDKAELDKLNTKLQNPGFVNKAPAAVVEAERERADKLAAVIAKLEEQLHGM